jgi:hypothetical protein
LTCNGLWLQNLASIKKSLHPLERTNKPSRNLM